MLESLAELLITAHVIGAALGAGGATMAEVLYTKAVADGKTTKHEYDYFARTFWALKWGMTTVLLSGIALTIVQYFLPSSPDEVLYAPLWIQNTLALVITTSAWLMGRSRIPWWAGSSIVFAGWWMMLLLDGDRTTPLSYLSLLFTFVVMVFASAAFWGYLRVLSHSKPHTRKHHS